MDADVRYIMFAVARTIELLLGFLFGVSSLTCTIGINVVGKVQGCAEKNVTVLLRTSLA